MSHAAWFFVVFAVGEQFKKFIILIAHFYNQFGWHPLGRGICATNSAAVFWLDRKFEKWRIQALSSIHKSQLPVFFLYEKCVQSSLKFDFGGVIQEEKIEMKSHFEYFYQMFGVKR